MMSSIHPKVASPLEIASTDPNDQTGPQTSQIWSPSAQICCQFIRIELECCDPVSQVRQLASYFQLELPLI